MQLAETNLGGKKGFLKLSVETVTLFQPPH